MDDLVKFQKDKYSKWDMDLGENRLKIVERFITNLPVGTMLDVGCSDGVFSEKFVKQGWKVYGVDISLSKLNSARRKGLKTKRVNIEKKLPYPSEKFNLVFAGEIIEHVVDTTKFLNEIKRVLVPGGRLILTTPNIASLENRFRVVVGMQPLWVDYKLEESSGHVRAYTLTALKGQLEDLGYENEVISGNFVSPWQLRWNDLNTPWLRILGTWFPSIAQDMIILTRKK